MKASHRYALRSVSGRQCPVMQNRQRAFLSFVHGSELRDGLVQGRECLLSMLSDLQAKVGDRVHREELLTSIGSTQCRRAGL